MRKLLVFIVPVIGFIFLVSFQSRPFDVLTVGQAKLTSVQEEPLVQDCNTWGLDKSDVEVVFKNSGKISSRDYFALYYSLPCELSGTVQKDEKKYQYTINAASKYILTSEDGVNEYYGCSKSICSDYFLISPDLPYVSE